MPGPELFAAPLPTNLAEIHGDPIAVPPRAQNRPVGEIGATSVEPMAKARRTKDERAAAALARELALTPVTNPYRGQFADPFADQRVPGGALLFAPGGRQLTAPAADAGSAAARVSPVPAGGATSPWGYDVTGQPIRAKAPSVAVAAGVIGLLLGVIVGVLGLLLIALISLVHNVDVGDRSFYEGQDGSYVLLGALNLVVSAALVIGSVAMLTGRLAGRIALTAAAWTVLGFSAYWMTQDVLAFIPIVLGLAGASVLVLAYHPTLTRWLGVLPPPQPE